MAGSDLVFNRDALGELFTNPQGEVAKDLARRAVMVQRRAKDLCPVDTGRLRASIEWALGNDSDGLFAVIGSNVEYAAYVELGTRYMQARPYLRPALEAAGG